MVTTLPFSHLSSPFDSIGPGNDSEAAARFVNGIGSIYMPRFPGWGSGNSSEK